jgi:DNA-binding GntR family transcriptional regulator
MSRSSPRAEAAYQALRTAIIEQALRPGAKLPEDQIGAHFGMSRTLVRATLARLQSEGLVEAKRKRTATVAEPSLDEAREIFEARRALEREIVALTVKRWRPEFRRELDEHVRAEDAARARRDDRVSIRLAGEFHLKLAALSGNRVLQRYLGELVSRCSLILALYGRPHSAECAVSEHAAIIAAIDNRDAARAIGEMDQHIGSVERRALLGDEPGDTDDLIAVLSHYFRPARPHVVPLSQRRGQAAG